MGCGSRNLGDFLAVNRAQQRERIVCFLFSVPFLLEATAECLPSAASSDGSRCKGSWPGAGRLQDS